MKTRVISGTVIGILLVGAYCLMFTPVIDLLFSALAAAACYEIINVAGVKNMVLRVIAIVFAGLIPMGLVGIRAEAEAFVSMFGIRNHRPKDMIVCSWPEPRCGIARDGADIPSCVHWDA